MRRLIILGLLFVLLFGCINNPPPVENTTNTTNQTPPLVMPSFTIATPSEDETFKVQGTSGAVDIVLTTKNLILKQSGVKKIGEGHFAFALDDATSVPVYQKTYTLDNVATGEHVLRIELVHNDGSSYSPKISRSVRFFVENEIKIYVPVEYVVSIKDFSYEPATLEANVGDKVTWVNNGAYPRSATCVGKFDTQVLGPGKNATITLTEPLECDYIALTHSAMKGHIKVNPAPGS
ncbi:MAG: hypothetical protein V1492_05240 [Candidatus Micrarchaeota archaeon]